MDESIFITFLRHGRSGGDDDGVHEGRYDAVLTEVGQQQIQARANGWKMVGVTFDTIIASPLQRAAYAANIVGATLDLPVELASDWMEMDNGLEAGLTFAEAAERYPQPLTRSPYEPFYVTGESDWELHSRALRALQGILRRGAGSYLVVAHGGIINAALRAIVGSPLAVNGHNNIWFAFGDAGYLRTMYNPNQHQWLVLEFCAK